MFCFFRCRCYSFGYNSAEVHFVLLPSRLNVLIKSRRTNVVDDGGDDNDDAVADDDNDHKTRNLISKSL